MTHCKYQNTCDPGSFKGSLGSHKGFSSGSCSGGYKRHYSSSSCSGGYGKGIHYPPIGDIGYGCGYGYQGGRICYQPIRYGYGSGCYQPPSYTYGSGCYQPLSYGGCYSGSSCYRPLRLGGYGYGCYGGYGSGGYGYGSSCGLGGLYGRSSSCYQPCYSYGIRRTSICCDPCN